MRTMSISLADIDLLTDGRFGEVDVACPFCGPQRRAVRNQRRKVLRIWRLEEGFATYHCVRCGEHGHARDRTARPAGFAREGAARRRQPSTRLARSGPETGAHN